MPDHPPTIVGIGASAGGLEAIESFFSAMPVDSGMAFVVIQHLSPDYKSMMVELLSRKTQIPVLRAEDGMKVEPDHIYLIPPKKNLTIFHRKLLLKDQEHRETPNLPVDIFLRSLAEDQGDKAVAVILSGTGSDGTRGVRAIKEWGGLVMVQDESSAKFDGMPRAAASTGLADFVLEPKDMPSQLVACLHHPYSTRSKNPAKDFENETGLTRLFSLLRAKTDVDFTFYKPTTINRRIERRIAVTQLADLEEYVRYLEQYPSEIAALYRELLIGVTSFFRDEAIMAQMRDTILPELFKRSDERELRFWVAGCSTGEEAYTLAMLCRETMEKLDLALDIKIFATDIDREAITKAGAGIYPESIAADLNPKLLAKYFYRRGDQYQIARNLREMVVFAQHNLVKNPPFTRIDCISCRNLLIYLQPTLQRKALEMFAFSLRPGGVLLLGASETVGDREDVFEPIDRKSRIYRARSRSSANTVKETDTDSHARRARSVSTSVLHERPHLSARFHDRMMSRLLEVIAEAFVPLAVVVNEHLEVLFTVGDSSGIFSLPSGRTVYDISKMVNRELGIPLTTGIQKVFRSDKELTYNNVRLSDGPNHRLMRLRILPLPGRKNDEPLAVVFFEDLDAPKASDAEDSPGYNLEEEASEHLQDLEQELQFTRENLQATIEELETSNEELQATNEELLASNEELQSTNEELQSTNEELYTVNSEYQNKIIELSEARNDVDNLLASSRIGTLILDEDLQIRRFSPQIAEIFHVVENDIGRPLKHLSHDLTDFDAIGAARKVIDSDRIIEQETDSEDGRRFLVRVLPYRVGPREFAGIVFTLIDITPLHEAHARLEHSQRTAADIVRNMPSGLFVYKVTESNELILESGNPAAEQITGLRIEACVQKTFSEIWPGANSAEIQSSFLEAYESGTPKYQMEVAYTDEQVRGVFHIHSFRLPGNRLAVAFTDVTEQKKAEQDLRKIEWLLTRSKPEEKESYDPPYSNLVSLNPKGTILQSVGKEMLEAIVSDYLNLLETSAAVYEKNGDYALGIFSSGWCRLMDASSFHLCGTQDPEAALNCGKWHCHESCWTQASKISIETGEPVDVPCKGGLNIYAVPITAGDTIVGSINFGYGDPPRDPDRIHELAELYQVDRAELLRQAQAYESRPPYIIELAKNKLKTSARLIGEIVERKNAHDALVESERFMQETINALPAHICVLDETGRIIAVNEAWNRFAENNAADLSCVSTGSNYLNVCDTASRQGDVQAAAIAEGIRAVLSGEQETFEHEYPCHSEFEQRWFLCKCKRFEGGGPPRVVIVHENITERKLAEQEAIRTRDLLADAEQTAGMGSWTWDIKSDTVIWSDNLYRLFQRDPEKGAVSFADHDCLYTPESMALLREAVQHTLEHKQGYALELQAVRADGSILPCIARGEPDCDESGNVIRLYGSFQRLDR